MDLSRGCIAQVLAAHTTRDDFSVGNLLLPQLLLGHLALVRVGRIKLTGTHCGDVIT